MSPRDVLLMACIVESSCLFVFVLVFVLVLGVKDTKITPKMHDTQGEEGEG